MTPKLAALQQVLKNNEVKGTLSALSVWLKSEFRGQLDVTRLEQDPHYKTLLTYQLTVASLSEIKKAAQKCAAQLFISKSVFLTRYIHDIMSL